jgi:hypothetical protein
VRPFSSTAEAVSSQDVSIERILADGKLVIPLIR